MAEPAIEGYRHVVEVEPTADQFDAQGHLNNAAVTAILGDLRIAYALDALGADWGEYLAGSGQVFVVRELHVRYDSEVMPGERLFGGTRVRERRGKAVVTEQVLVSAADGRTVASAWLVNLLAESGRAVVFPETYWERVAALEGRSIPEVASPSRPAWGPPR